MSKTPDYFTPFKCLDELWFFVIPEKHGSPDHIRCGKGDIVFGPYKDQTACDRHAKVVRQGVGG